MAKRTGITKKIRFEVFKRDSFTCQYCGREAPNVVLEIDHILPVSKGGKNDLLNLITSCRDCNRGKTNKTLDDNSMVCKQKKQLDEIQQRKEIIEMMAEWKKEMMLQSEREVDIIDDFLLSISSYKANETGRKHLKALIKRFGFQSVYDATELSFYKYFDITSEDPGVSWNEAFDKIGGICYNKSINRGKDYYGY